MAADANWQLTFLNGLLRASWQASVLILFVLAVRWIFGRILPPRWSYGLWLLVLVRLAIPFSLESAFSVFNYLPELHSMLLRREPAPVHSAYLPPPDIAPLSSDPSLRAPAAPPPVSPAAPKLVPPRQPSMLARIFPALLFPLWLAGALLLLLRVLWLNYRLAFRMRRIRPLSDIGLLDLARECQQLLDLRNTPWIVETSEVRSPSLFGFSVPWLLLPERMLESFSPAELRFILLHELVHFRRRDILLNWLATLVQILHWFNPLAWLAFARLRSTRELARDAEVLAHLGPEEAKVYGGTIVRLLEGFTQSARVPGLAGILEERHEMKRRIAMILSYPGKALRWRWAAVPALALLAAGTLTDARVSKTAGVFEGEEAGQKILVRVMDAETGGAIAGATLNRTERTDAAGTCSLSISFPAIVLARAEGHVPKIVSLDGESVRGGECQVRLEKGITIGGLVVDSSGRALQGAAVTLPRLVFPENYSGASPGAGDVTVLTDRDGRWRCTEVPRASRGVEILLNHAEHGTTLYRGGVPAILRIMPTISSPAFIPWDDLIRGTATLAMLPGIPVRVRVLDPQWNPIAGASIRLRRSLPEVSVPSDASVTGADGRFEFRNGSAGAAFLTAWAKGYVAKPKTIEIRDGSEEITLVLERGLILRGRVLDGAGKPVAGAVVRGERQGEFDLNTKTDGEGRFDWDSAPARPFTLSLSAPGYAPAYELVQAGDNESVLRLRPLRRIEVAGRVVDAATRQPIPRFEVLASMSRGLTGRYYNFQSKALGRDGRFRTYFEDSTRPAGTVVQWDASGDRVLHHVFGLKIKAEGYVPDESKAVAIESGDVSIEVALEKARTLAGIVRLPGGEPAPGAALHVPTSNEWPALEADGRVRLLFDEDAALQSDGAGRFAIMAGAETSTVVVTHPAGIALTDTRKLAETPVITLERWASIRGRVLIGDRPGARLGLYLTGSMVAPGSSMPGLKIRYSAETDETGRFLFERVPAAIYSLAPRDPSSPGGVLFRKAMLVAVNPGEDLVLELRVAGMPVVGRVTLANSSGTGGWVGGTILLEPKEKVPLKTDFADEPSRRAWIRARLATEEGRHSLLAWIPVAQVKEDGTFRFDDVPAGAYKMVFISWLMKSESDSPLAVREVVVPRTSAGRDQALDLGTIHIR